MQNASSSGPPPGANSGHNWATPALPDMYTSHQRSNSNPRPYAAPAAETVATDSRRDEASNAGHNVYAGGEGGYAGYQSSAGYGAPGNVAYGYSGGMGMPAYSPATASPPRSRRASGPKPASSPPPASPATNTSPSSRYYSSQNQAVDVVPSHAQSPYQSSSAPPQVVSHHHTMSGQPQTAHPYGGGYYSYYDQSQQQHQAPGQWPSHYPQTGSHGFQQSSPVRPGQQAGSNTPAVNPSSSHHSHRTAPSASSSNTFDYTSSGGPSPYPVWSGQDPARAAGHQQQSWQTPVSGGGRMGGIGGPGQTMSQSQWQGYAGHSAMPAQGIAQHHINPAPVPSGQYAWPQWNAQSYGYPSTTSQQPHPGQTGTLPGVHGPLSMPAGGKKHKKDKKSGVIDPAEYQGLGKRLADSGEDDGDERKEGKSQKKGKKEEEKFPKLPAKSQLHPPRQAQSAWQLFFTDELNKAKAAAAQDASPGGTLHHAKLNVAQIAKDAGASYANLDEEQRVYYTQKVLESKEMYAKDLAVWQATLTPEDIRAENAFRAQQRKEGKSRKGNLKDPNAPKKPLSAYFLFLKGIRENDELRANVWGEETETTKQSVLAAERWRGLSVDEKKPYLQQAERDKQDYETQRKLYEGDAAARARGEDVPQRTLPIPDLPIKLELPKPRKQGPVMIKPDPRVKSEDAVDPDFGEFTHDDSSDHIEGEGRSMEIEDFSGFHDPLEDIDLSGFHEISGDPVVEHPGQWGDLHHLMGGLPDEGKVAAAIGSSTAEDVGADLGIPSARLDPELNVTTEESADTSVAPTLTEAVGETSELAPVLGSAPASLPLDPGPAVPLEIVAEDEGALSVPVVESESTFTRPDNALETSGVPTEEINELPPADLPPTIDELPMNTGDQIGSTSSPEPSTVVAKEAPEVHATPLALVNSLINAEDPEPTAPPAVEEQITADPAGSFETAMLGGEIAPEAIHDEISLEKDVTAAPATADESTVSEDVSEPMAKVDGV